MSKEKKPAELSALTEARRHQAMARFRIIEPFLENPSTPAHTLLEAIAKQADTSVRTIQRWIAAYQKNGLVGLARRERDDKGAFQIPADLKAQIEALFMGKSRRSMTTVHSLAVLYAKDKGLPVPSYAQVRDICKALPAAEVCYARRGPRTFRAAYDPISRHESNYPNERWQMDHTQIDLKVVDAVTHEIIRPWLTLAIDTYSRAIMGFYLSPDAPASHSVALCLRHAIWHKSVSGWVMCGIPDQIHVDNGADLRSEHVEQIAAHLGFRIIFATPGLPRGKGKNERLFDTLNRQLWCELPGYTKDTSGKQNRPSLTLDAVRKLLSEWIVSVYHLRQHRTTGETPYERWNNGFIPRLPKSLEDLDLLLLKSTPRKVQRDGIHFHNLRYWADLLPHYIGETVVLRYDTQDISEAYAYYQDQPLCKVVALGLESSSASLAEIQAAQRQFRQEIKASVDARKKILNRELTLDILLKKGGKPRTEAPSPKPVQPYNPSKPEKKATPARQLALFRDELTKGEESHEE